VDALEIEVGLRYFLRFTSFCSSYIDAPSLFPVRYVHQPNQPWLVGSTHVKIRSLEHRGQYANSHFYRQRSPPLFAHSLGLTGTRSCSEVTGATAHFTLDERSNLVFTRYLASEESRFLQKDVAWMWLTPLTDRWSLPTPFQVTSLESPALT
jgi:hypothetical protein